MAEFRDLIVELLEVAGARTILEIGAEHGGTTRFLADFCTRKDGQLITIEPSPGPELLAWIDRTPQVHHVPEHSLDVIDTISGVDAWLINGDHNYYTVFNELAAADVIARRDGKPLLVILHDVGWPCSRRDMYDVPERIPREFRQPYSFNARVMLDDPGHHIDRGFRPPRNSAVALRAGGPRNGVLTAIEDFISLSEDDDRTLLYAHVPAIFGLGILFDSNAPWADVMAEVVSPFHDNPLLERMERDRLRHYQIATDRTSKALRH